jgi:hypothetical protein
MSLVNVKQAETIIDLVKGAKMKAKEDVEPLRTPSGVYIDNHNETTMGDHEDEGEAQLADLPVADEQAYETKGGQAAARWSQAIIGDIPDYN